MQSWKYILYVLHFVNTIAHAAEHTQETSSNKVHFSDIVLKQILNNGQQIIDSFHPIRYKTRQNVRLRFLKFNYMDRSDTANISVPEDVKYTASLH